MGQRKRPAWVLSPCGTSVLTNQVGDDGQLRGLLADHANTADPSEIPAGDADRIRRHVEMCGQSLADASSAEAAELSAELNGICTFYGGHPRTRTCGPPDQHLLLSTDTWLGRECGRLIADWLQGRGLNARLKKADDLRTDDLFSFRAGLTGVARWIGQQVPQWSDRGYEIVFNLTGGFKSVQGILQTLATFYAERSIYVFRTGELMEIPRLPVRLDIEGTVRDHLETFRQLGRGAQLPADECGGIPETLLMEVGGEVGLSEWGEAIWGAARKPIYGEKLLPPHHRKIEFTKKFRQSVDGLAADRLRHINERIDDLAQYLDSGRQKKKDRLSYKKLAGQPVPDSTHEFYAWSDRDARRIFCHEEGDTVVLDKLSDHL